MNQPAPRPRATWWLLAQWLGIPDGAAGHALLADDRAGQTFDCYLDPCRARWALGDGWYWVEHP